MRVAIDDLLVVECSHLLNGGETWNGWGIPVFTQSQLDPIAKWWADNDGDNWDGSTWAEQTTDLGNGEYVLYGWTWQVVEGVK